MKLFGGEKGGELFGTEKKVAATQRKELGLRGSQLRGFRGVDLGSCLMVEEGREGSESTDVQGVWARWLIRQQFPPEVKGCRWNPSRKGKDPSPEIKELGFVPREGEDRENWSEGQQLQGLVPGIQFSQHLQRPLCARPCARPWGFKGGERPRPASRSPAQTEHMDSSVLPGAGGGERGAQPRRDTEPGCLQRLPWGQWSEPSPEEQMGVNQAQELGVQSMSRGGGLCKDRCWGPRGRVNLPLGPRLGHLGLLHFSESCFPPL